MARPKEYLCNRCGARLPDFMAFETDWPHQSRYWCLYHIPWHTRVRLKWREMNMGTRGIAIAALIIAVVVALIVFF